MLICGVDEAGRGPVIGPMTVAGVAIEDKSLIRLQELGVKDSKTHTPKRREKLALMIKKVAQAEILILTPEELDAKMEFLTLNQIEANAFAEIIKRFKPAIAYVDSADVNEERFANSIRAKLDFNLQIISKHYADKFYRIVSSASILAKVARDNEIKRIEEELGEVIGSGYPSDKRTIEFITRWVKEKGYLPPYTRKSWKTVAKLVK